MTAKNPISLLQERTMQNRGLLPVYQMESIGTMEQPRFKCTVKTVEITAEGEARNKKDAKQRAAENALVKLGYRLSTSTLRQPEPPQIKPIETPPDSYNPYHNYIGLLNEYASGHRRNYPDYHDLYEDGQFKSVCQFMNLETEAYGRNKKDAKRLAAFKMMELLKTAKLPVYQTTPTPMPFVKPPKPTIELNSTDKIIMQKFAELSISLINRSHGNNNGIDMKPHPQLEKKNYSIEEAGEKLLNLGYSFNLNTMQNDPYIVAIQLAGKEFTLIGFGETEAEATKKVLNDSIDLVRGGCSSFVPERNLPLTI